MTYKWDGTSHKYGSKIPTQTISDGLQSRWEAVAMNRR